MDTIVVVYLYTIAVPHIGMRVLCACAHTTTLIPSHDESATLSFVPHAT